MDEGSSVTCMTPQAALKMGLFGKKSEIHFSTVCSDTKKGKETSATAVAKVLIWNENCPNPVEIEVRILNTPNVYPPSDRDLQILETRFPLLKQHNLARHPQEPIHLLIGNDNTHVSHGFSDLRDEEMKGKNYPTIIEDRWGKTISFAPQVMDFLQQAEQFIADKHIKELFPQMDLKKMPKQISHLTEEDRENIRKMDILTFGDDPMSLEENPTGGAPITGGVTITGGVSFTGGASLMGGGPEDIEQLVGLTQSEGPSEPVSAANTQGQSPPEPVQTASAQESAPEPMEVDEPQPEVSNYELHKVLERQWTSDNMYMPKRRTLAEETCMRIISKSYHQWHDGSICVQLPFREGYPEGLPKNYAAAKAKQQRMLQSYKDDEAAMAAYAKFKEDFVDQGFLMPMPEHLEKEMFYITYFFVKRESSETTPVRIVVNCAERWKPGNMSINDALYTGENLLNKIPIMLIKFRTKKYIITLDISKMFHRIKLLMSNAVYLGIFLGDKAMYFSSLPFGLVCAPTIAIYCVKRILQEHGSKELLECLDEQIYMDDITFSHNDPEVLLRAVKEAVEILNKHNFPCGKMTTNYAGFMSEFDDKMWASSMRLKLEDDVTGANSAMVKTLGIRWECKEKDVFIYESPLTVPLKITKRAVAALVAQVYDPVGLLLPCMLKGKLVLQKICILQRQYDNTKVMLKIRHKELADHLKIKGSLLTDNEILAIRLKTLTCPDCIADKHKVTQCPYFINGDAAMKFKLLFLTNTCGICLKVGHVKSGCTSGLRCKRCKSPLHHTELHKYIIDWDSDLRLLNVPEAIEFIKMLLQWIPEMADLCQIEIPRQLPAYRSVSSTLVIFADGSSTAYAALCYVRTLADDGSIHCTLVAGRMRLAPIRSPTIPNMELLGMNLGAELSCLVSEALNIEPIGYMSDSSTACWWTHRPGRQESVFVRSKLENISRLTNGTPWQYVKTDENPADIPTRGCTPLELKNNALYWHGPEFLRDPPEKWPKFAFVPKDEDLLADESISFMQDFFCLFMERNSNLSINMNTLLIDLTFKKEKAIFETEDVLLTTRELLNEFGKEQIPWNKSDPDWVGLVHCQALGLKFLPERKQVLPLTNLDNLSKIVPNDHSIPEQDLRNAVQKLILRSQYECYADNIKKFRKGQHWENVSLKTKGAFIDSEGFIRVRTRISEFDVAEITKFPIWLGVHRITKIMAMAEHVFNGHIRGDALKKHLDLRFAGQIPALVSHVNKACPTCQGRLNLPKSQKMTQLKDIKKLTQLKPFFAVSLDCYGPLRINAGLTTTRTKGKIPVYILVVICKFTKAIHAEALTSVDTENVIMGLRRTAGNVGGICHIRSDNAGAFKKLGAECNKEIDWEEVKRALADRIKVWEFSTPYDHEGNALAEAAVKIVQNTFHKIKGVKNVLDLTFEQFRTLLVEAMWYANNRPICSNDRESVYKVICPNFFLMKHLGNDLCPLIPIDTLPYDRLRAQEEFLDKWCEILYEQTLINVRPFQKWSTEIDNVKPGQLVVVPEDNVKRYKWKVAKIVDVNVHQDKLVREASVLIDGKTKPVWRSMRYLIPLTFFDEENSFKSK